MTPPMPEGTVFIIDDDEAIRDSLAWLFDSRGYRAATFASAEAFLAAAPLDHCGCLLLDVRMDGMTGLELQASLNDRGCRLPVILLTGHGDVPMAVQALKAGAFDFLEKPFNDNQLVDRVAEALEHDLASRRRRQERDSVSARLAGLTPREREVMRLVLAGKMNKVIADQLGISVKTVEVHRARLLEKVGVRSAVELARVLGGTDGG